MEGEMLHTVYLGLGANLGDREQTILRAYRHIERLIGPLKGRSAFFYSEPWGFQSDHGFVNSVAAVLTVCTPREVLHRTKLIERRLGKTCRHATRRHGATVYHDRPIDIDILLYDDRRIDEPDLQIPHPLMSQRPFVMQPLKEVMALTGDHSHMMP
ncbi:MAG: 2-amino-4-hydroxy-6-hydroxymethyldihydropteridine diphosphokinase [Prevotella sp.]|nr:2-amino-4-hydroxy-6-hydroxymethyldihydropteridine diphosphokinase [Prevotella sp.]